MKTSAQVLIVDNNPDDVRLVRDILESAGFGIHVRTDGVSAIEAFHTIHPDLVLIDAHIPEASGLEVSREINQTELGRSTPIVLISDERIEPRRRAETLKGSGLASFLEKPLEPTQLLETMARLLPGAFIAIPSNHARTAAPARPVAPAPPPAPPRPAPRAPTRSLSPTTLPELDAFDEDALGELLDKVFPENDSGDVAAVLTESISAHPSAATAPPTDSIRTESLADLENASLEALRKTVSIPAPSEGFDLAAFHDVITDDTEVLAPSKLTTPPQPTGGARPVPPRTASTAAGEPMRPPAETTTTPAAIEPRPAVEPAPPATTYSLTGSTESRIQVVAPRPPKPIESLENIPIAEIDEEDFTRPVGSHVQARTGGAKMHSVKVAPPATATLPGVPSAAAEMASGRATAADASAGLSRTAETVTRDGELAAQPRRGGVFLLVAAGATVAIAAGIGALFLVRSGRSGDLRSTEEPASRVSSERPVTERPLIPESEGSSPSAVSPAEGTRSGAGGSEGPPSPPIHAPASSTGAKPGSPPQTGLAPPGPAAGRGSSPMTSAGSPAASKGVGSAKPAPAQLGSAPAAPRSPAALEGSTSSPASEQTSSRGEGGARDAVGVPGASSEPTSPDASGPAGQTASAQPGAAGAVGAEPKTVPPPAETSGVSGPSGILPSVEGDRPASESSESAAQGEDFVSPVAIHRTSPIYPLIARSMKTSGTVKLLVKVEEDGSVSEVRVAKAVSPPLDKAAVAAARAWKYTPAKRGGRAVGAWVEESVVFNLR